MLKLATNNADVRSNRRNLSSTSLCRHCGEFETLAHVLGKCPKGELLRNCRHHRVCDLIVQDLQGRKWRTMREDRAVTSNGDSRFTDIVAIDAHGVNGFILDPTVRWEKDLEQAIAVDAEKRAHYIDTIPHYRAKFPGVKNWTVYGLLFGSRGTMPKFTYDVLKGLGIARSTAEDIIVSVVKDSLRILHHHLYARS